MLLSFAPTELMLAAIAIPFIGALAIVVCSFHRNVREAATLTTAFSLFWVVISLLPHILDGARPSVTLVEPLAGLGIAFAVEPLGMLFALIASGLWIVNSIYSIGYMRGNNEPRQTLFYLCFAIALGATMGLAFSANLLTLFLCYEILTLSTYPLVTHKMNDNAKEAGRVYLGLLIGTSMVLLLPAILFTWAVAGTVTFTPGGVLPETMTPLAVGMLFALFLFGIGKAAVMPGHAWLPAAMVAPTPVSALLHAVAVVKAGVFTVVKVVVYIFGIETLSSTGQGAWLVPVAGFTIVVASLIALQQSNLKKRLAFSTVSQLSYVVLAAAILTPISAVGAAMHIAAHAVSKITLFFAAGSIYTAAHLTEIPQLKGIGWRMPWTMTAFTIGALSMIGLPPTAGFLGKWFMLSGAMATEQWIALGVIVASTVLNAAYFLPIVYTAFFEAPDDAATGSSPHGEAPLPIVAALTVTAALTLGLFFFPDVPMALASDMVGLVR